VICATPFIKPTPASAHSGRAGGHRPSTQSSVTVYSRLMAIVEASTSKVCGRRSPRRQRPRPRIRRRSAPQLATTAGGSKGAPAQLSGRFRTGAPSLLAAPGASRPPTLSVHDDLSARSHPHRCSLPAGRQDSLTSSVRGVPAGVDEPHLLDAPAPLASSEVAAQAGTRSALI
jgi:hypothetical protein